jgi:hypothetical protein
MSYTINKTVPPYLFLMLHKLRNVAEYGSAEEVTLCAKYLDITNRSVV